jgi:hypothetical protein
MLSKEQPIVKFKSIDDQTLPEILENNFAFEVLVEKVVVIFWLQTYA